MEPSGKRSEGGSRRAGWVGAPPSRLPAEKIHRTDAQAFASSSACWRRGFCCTPMNC